MTTIKIWLNNLKYFNWKLFISLCLLALVPAIYQAIRTALISLNSDTSIINILGQMEWYDLISETLKAFLVIPLYSVFNKIYVTEKENFSSVIFKTGIIAFIIYFIFQIICYFYGQYLISIMVKDNVELTTQYLRLETISFAIEIISSLAMVVFVVLSKNIYVYLFLVIKCVLLVISDFIIIPNIGALGVAYSNIFVNSLLSLSTLIILILNKFIKPSLLNKSDLSVFKMYLKIGMFSGLQSFVDNFIYMLMVVKMVNMVANQGSYWLANNFIYGWLLIPITALTEIIRSDCKKPYKSLMQSNYYFIVIITSIIWLATMPTWNFYLAKIEKLENFLEINNILLKLVPFYIAYSLCVIPDNIFIGYGKTVYNLCNSLIINFIYYGIFYLLTSFSIISMSLDMIILMFGFGMVTHLFVSYIEQYIFIKRSLPKLK